MMVSASDLLTLYIGLELNCLAAYVLAAFLRSDDAFGRSGAQIFRARRARQRHPALRHQPALRLYRHHQLRRRSRAALAGGIGRLGALFGIVFVLAGLAFKISAVPFHMWTPDVYEGAPTPVTAFFATAPKVAAHGADHARRDRGVRRAGGCLAADRDLRGAGLDRPRRASARSGRPISSGCWPIRSINNVGFMPDRPCRGDPAGRRGDAGLPRDLCGDDAGQLRCACCSCAMTRWQPVEAIARFRRPVADAARPGAAAGDLHVQPCRHSAAVRFLAQVRGVPGGGCGRSRCRLRLSASPLR